MKTFKDTDFTFSSYIQSLKLMIDYFTGKIDTNKVIEIIPLNLGCCVYRWYFNKYFTVDDLYDFYEKDEPLMYRLLGDEKEVKSKTSEARKEHSGDKYFGGLVRLLQPKINSSDDLINKHQIMSFGVESLKQESLIDDWIIKLNENIDKPIIYSGPLSICYYNDPNCENEIIWGTGFKGNVDKSKCYMLWRYISLDEYNKNIEEIRKDKGNWYTKNPRLDDVSIDCLLDYFKEIRLD